jgi:signal transduction histidine kinase
MKRYDLAEVLERVSYAVFGVFDIQELQERVVDLCQDIFDAEACSLFLVDERCEELIMVAARGYSAQFLGRSAPLVRSDQVVEHPSKPEDKLGITGWIASTGHSFMSNTPEEHRVHPHWTGKYDIQQFGPNKRVHNFYGVPLKVAENDIIGVLKVEGKREGGKYRSFSETDTNLFNILSAYITLAISGAWRVEEIRRQREQLQTTTDALHKVVASLSEELPMQYLLDEIVATTAEVLSAEACVLFLVDPADSSRLIETAGKGYAEHLIGKAEYKLVPKRKLVEQPERYEDRVGLTAWIAITGQPFLARDNDELRKHPHWRGQYDKEHYPEGSGKKCESFLGLPLRVGNEVLGVLKVENKNIGGRYVPFDEREQHIFQLLANSAAIAIHNARELQKFQEARELAAIGQSATAMAHSMRTPLQDIRLTAELLEEKLQKIPSVPKLSLQNVRDIILRVDQMDGAIKRVREAAQQLKPELKFHDIGDILCSSFTQNPSFAQQFRKLKIKAEIVGLEQIRDRSIKCDRHLLEEAIGNLVANASEAVSDGGRVSIHIKETNGDLCIEVQDSGPGIDENLLPLTSLFEPFRSTKKGGLGLGLVIVRRNVGAHGGNVSYERTSHSTCFRIEIPRKGQRED